MRSIFYISFAILSVQWVCNGASTGNKKTAESVSCMPGSLQTLNTLTWRQPAVDFSVTLDSLKKAAVLNVIVKEVKNPGLVPVSFSLLFYNASRQWVLPGFTLYPSDKTGVFNFNISESVNLILKSNPVQESKSYGLRILLDTTAFNKINKLDVESLQIKICSPVFK